MSRAPRGLTIAQRLEWTGWNVTDSGCWEWRASTNQNGYGHVWFEGRLQQTHRLAYVTWVGPIPANHVVRHKSCNNPPCINPDHLVSGTQKDNMQDRDEQNRRRPPRGVLNGRASLTEPEVFEIKFRLSEGERVTDIARSFGITISKVSHIKNGVTWATN